MSLFPKKVEYPFKHNQTLSFSSFSFMWGLNQLQTSRTVHYSRQLHCWFIWLSISHYISSFHFIMCVLLNSRIFIHPKLQTLCFWVEFLSLRKSRICCNHCFCLSVKTPCSTELSFNLSETCVRMCVCVFTHISVVKKYRSADRRLLSNTPVCICVSTL